MSAFASQSGPRKCLAAIDVGSNSTHMLLVELGQQGTYQVLESLKEQTRLAADIDERLLLDANALSKMAIVLKRMREIAERHQAIIRCVATHPLREARNGIEFANRLSSRSGVPVEIVSGQEEARLVSLGVRAGLPISDRSSLIVDVGGGSSEIILCQWDEVRFATSLKLGAVRLSRKFLSQDPFTERDLRSLEEYVHSRLEPVVHELQRFGFDLAVGSSGTVKALKALAVGMKGGDSVPSYHGAILTRDELVEVSDLLFRNRSLHERKMLPRMDAKRADVIVAGAMVLNTLARLADIRSYTISTSALREGIVVDALARERQWLRGDSRDVRWVSVRDLGQRLRIDEPHAFHIATLTMALFDSLPPNLVGQRGMWRELLRCAAYLHECGKFINVSGFHKHAYYLIKNSTILGFSQRELDAIATLVRFHRKRVPRPDDDDLELFDREDQQTITRFATLLRLAVSLDRGRQGRIRRVQLSAPKAGRMLLSVFVPKNTDAGVEMYELNCEKGPFERAFEVSLDVRVEEVTS